MHSTTILSVIWQRTSAALATVVMATFGISGFVSADSITNTGPDSTNTISNTARTDCTVRNTNDVHVTNSNDQTANTGVATSSGNTTGGSATTGNAVNQNDTAIKGSINNGQAAEDCVCVTLPAIDELSAEISTTGPDSTNVITNTTTTTTTVTNTNDITITNSNDQSATTGDATVSHNTTGGDATTGDATNTNAAEFLLNLTNTTPVAAVAHASAVADLCKPAVTPPTPGVGGLVEGITTHASFTSAPRPAGGRGGGGFFSPRFVARSSNNTAVVHAAGAPAPVVPAVVAPAPTAGKGGGVVIPTPVAVPSNSISNTGPDSINTISNTVSNSTQITNTNTVNATNTNNQIADTGNATVSGNTTAGAGGSGAADNTNATGVGVAVTN